MTSYFDIPRKYRKSGKLIPPTPADKPKPQTRCQRLNAIIKGLVAKEQI